MNTKEINLKARFVLEIIALITFGFWGWELGEGWVRIILALALPVFFAAIWGIFAVPEDPSRSGKAPVPVPGIIRLVIEWLFFALASWVLYEIGHHKMSLIFGGLVVLHYILSQDRIKWLLLH